MCLCWRRYNQIVLYEWNDYLCLLKVLLLVMTIHNYYPSVHVPTALQGFFIDFKLTVLVLPCVTSVFLFTVNAF